MNSVSRVCILASCVFAAMGTALQAGQKPDFNGTWKLDTLRSRFNQLPAPKGTKIIIEDREPKLHVEIKTESEKGNQDQVFDLATDGTEAREAGTGGTSTASALWGGPDGTRLVLTIKEPSSNGPVITSREMKSYETGKMLTTVLTVQNAAGKQRADEFFTRER